MLHKIKHQDKHRPRERKKLYRIKQKNIYKAYRERARLHKIKHQYVHRLRERKMLHRIKQKNIYKAYRERERCYIKNTNICIGLGREKCYIEENRTISTRPRESKVTYNKTAKYR